MFQWWISAVGYVLKPGVQNIHYITRHKQHTIEVCCKMIRICMCRIYCKLCLTFMCAIVTLLIKATYLRTYLHWFYWLYRHTVYITRQRIHLHLARHRRTLIRIQEGILCQSSAFWSFISAKWTEWTGEISCDAFFLPSFRPSVHTQYLDANISKTVWDRDSVLTGHHLPPQPYIKAVKKFTWRIYALSEHLLV